MHVKEKIVPLKVYSLVIITIIITFHYLIDNFLLTVALKEWNYIASSIMVTTTVSVLQIDLRVNNTVVRDQFLWVCITSSNFHNMTGLLVFSISHNVLWISGRKQL